MTDQEILELPKVWVVGGDGGMGDIGCQNTSKVILQNRPNLKAVMLDTQVYSNTGGQNSDSTPKERLQAAASAKPARHAAAPVSAASRPPAPPASDFVQPAAS